MKLYNISTKSEDHEVGILAYLDERGDIPEFGAFWDFIEAETRNKAKAKFYMKHDLPFTEPLNITKVIECSHCNNEGTVDYESNCPVCNGRSYRH